MRFVVNGSVMGGQVRGLAGGSNVDFLFAGRNRESEPWPIVVLGLLVNVVQNNMAAAVNFFFNLNGVNQVAAVVAVPAAGVGVFSSAVVAIPVAALDTIVFQADATADLNPANLCRFTMALVTAPMGGHLVTDFSVNAGQLSRVGMGNVDLDGSIAANVKQVSVPGGVTGTLNRVAANVGEYSLNAPGLLRLWRTVGFVDSLMASIVIDGPGLKFPAVQPSIGVAVLDQFRYELSAPLATVGLARVSSMFRIA